MSRLLLVRHAQASFLTEDYDRLSDHGVEQARQLALVWRERGIVPARVVSGPRRRQRDTAAELCAVLGLDGGVVPAFEQQPELDEYPADDVLAGLAAVLQADEGAAALMRTFQTSEDRRARGRSLDLLLRRALLCWAEDGPELPGVESFAQFRQRTARALAALTSSAESGQTVVAVSSAGSIGAIVGHVLGTDARRTLELGFVLENASVTELRFSAGRVGLARYNDVGHLPESMWTRR